MGAGLAVVKRIVLGSKPSTTAVASECRCVTKRRHWGASLRGVSEGRQVQEQDRKAGKQEDHRFSAPLLTGLEPPAGSSRFLLGASSAPS